MTAKILIVDDNKINLLIAQRLAAVAGFEALCAYSGQEAIKLFKERKPDLILMDLAMPEMDGFEAVSRIAGLEECGQFKTPIIAMTAQSAKAYKGKCLESGFVDFLEKPVQFDEAVETLRRFLPSAESELIRNH